MLTHQNEGQKKSEKLTNNRTPKLTYQT